MFSVLSPQVSYKTLESPQTRGKTAVGELKVNVQFPQL